PFCGYNMADYWNHWLSLKDKVKSLPAIFRVNWFRKDDNGKFMWPGFGQNMRVLKWIIDRVNGRGGAVESPFGCVPRFADLKWDGLSYPSDKFAKLMEIDKADAIKELDDQEHLFAKFDGRTPQGLLAQRQQIRTRVEKAADVWHP
ncbi:MAG: phosphoenolpyruvate carboxykinase (GTP), partial [Rhodobacteraceae bacterium]|nr:phosphoenolpyruvate carboxykinase (GTP) [Paracoccaceae bacterium]